MNQQELENLQRVQLTIMDEVHKLCVNNDLRYYLIGGSALGAIRHSGFIPWDVDIDIAMPRKDYELFITRYSKEIDSKCCVIDYRSEKNYNPPHALVILKNSVLLQELDELNPQMPNYGIFVDVLPLDTVPNNLEKRKKQEKDLIKIRKLKEKKVSLVYPKNTKLEIVLKKIRRVVFTPVSMTRLNRKQQEIMMRYDYLKEDENTIWCSMASHYKYEKLCMNKSVFGDPLLADFAGRQYYVPRKVDDYLTRLFGDYMRLPSEKEQMRLRNLFKYARW